MKIQIRLLAVAFLGAVLISACSPQLKVTTDYDKAVNFTQYKTYAIDTLRISSSVSQLNQTRIVNAVKQQMTAKGFTESANPDMLVHVSAIVKNKQSMSSTTDYYGYGGYYRPYGWGGGMGSTGYTTYNVTEYKEGSLIIDLVDAKTKNLVWEGIGNKEIDASPSDPDAAITAAVTKIMADYPPGAKK